MVRVTQIVYKGFSYSGKILTIGPGGMYMETDAPLCTNELFKTEIIQSEDLSEGDTCLCCVAWSHSRQDSNTRLYGYGVLFLRAPLSAYFLPLRTQKAIASRECLSA